MAAIEKFLYNQICVVEFRYFYRFGTYLANIFVTDLLY